MSPDVITKVKIPGTEFVLLIYAFRKVRPSEAKTAAAFWLKQNHRRTFPKRGTGKVMTILGSDDQA